MMNRLPRKFALPILMFFLSAIPGWAEPSSGAIRDGDRWVFLGDSITAQNTYVELLKQVFKHYHPEASLTFINSGMAGDRASSDPAKLVERVTKHNPTVVSVMYGMNEAINNYCTGSPKEKELMTYREALTYIAHTLKEMGITVLLMSPTLTDPSAHSFFNLDKSQAFLKECARIVGEVAKEEGVFYVPVQEEFEAFQDGLPLGMALIPDGVHPAALGHYQIARSLWRHGGLDGTLGTGDRELSPGRRELPVSAKLASRFLSPDAQGVELMLTATTAATVKAIWTIGDLRKEETLALTAGENRWTIPLNAGELPSRNGQSKKLIFDLKTAEAGGLFIVDLARTEVLHFKDNRIVGTIDSEGDRAEGRRIANWQAERVDDDLLLSFEVFDNEINPKASWPFARDGLNLMLDYRPTGHFADLGLDRGVTQLFLDVREKPFFGVGVRAWTGQGMDFAATAAGAKTPTGYTVNLLINNPFKLHTPSSLKDRDFIGLLVAVGDSPAPGGPGGLTITGSQKNDGAVNDYANNLPIIDLKNQLPGDAVINAHLFPIPVP